MLWDDKSRNGRRSNSFSRRESPQVPQVLWVFVNIWGHTIFIPDHYVCRQFISSYKKLWKNKKVSRYKQLSTPDKWRGLRNSWLKRWVLRYYFIKRSSSFESLSLKISYAFGTVLQSTSQVLEPATCLLQGATWSKSSFPFRLTPDASFPVFPRLEFASSFLFSWAWNRLHFLVVAVVFNVGSLYLYSRSLALLLPSTRTRKICFQMIFWTSGHSLLRISFAHILSLVW